MWLLHDTADTGYFVYNCKLQHDTDKEEIIVTKSLTNYAFPISLFNFFRYIEL